MLGRVATAIGEAGGTIGSVDLVSLDDELTLRDIGEILGLSRERVRQIESRAEAKCRRSVRRR
jgi:hypothetical protein